MPAADPSDLVDALASVDVTAHRTTPARFTETLQTVLERPAVGVALDHPSLSLEGTPVTVDPTPAEVKAATTGVTSASWCVEEYGSLVVSSDVKGTELVSLFVDRHVAVLFERDVVSDMETGFESFGERLADARSSAVIATGPSATADMGELVVGAHGPSEVFAVVVDEEDGEE